jgi:hypothetical protein
MNYHWDLLVFGCFWFMAQLHIRNRVFPTSTSTSTNSSKKVALISFPGSATQSMRQPRFRLCHSVSLILAVLWPVHASLPPTLAPRGRTKLCDRRVTSQHEQHQAVANHLICECCCWFLPLSEDNIQENMIFPIKYGGFADEKSGTHWLVQKLRMGFSINGGSPSYGWFIMKNLIKTGNLEVPPV